MNAFQKYGIERLSPSSLNCWLAAPGAWAMRYLAGVRDEGVAAMWRGTAVEAGLHRLLLGKSETVALEAATEAFNNLCQGECSEEIDAERALIPGMIGSAFRWQTDCIVSKAAPPLAAVQLRVETRLDGVSVPVIGYLDFTFMEGADIDCKTTKACPSKPKPDHVRQLALYWQARQRPQSLLYLTEKKFAHYPVPEADLRQGIVDLTRAAQSLERFLSVVPDAETAIRSLPMDTDSYLFGEAAKTKLMEMQEAF